MPAPTTVGAPIMADPQGIIPMSFIMSGFGRGTYFVRNASAAGLIRLAGITLLMAENARTGFVWEQFGKNPEVAKGLELAGFLPNAKS